MSEELILDAVLCEGGGARVHLARWRGRIVSAKVARSPDPAASRELRAEAELGARLRHRALAPVLGSGDLPDGRRYVLFPRLEGEHLAARLAHGPLAIADAIEIARVIGEGSLPSPCARSPTSWISSSPRPSSSSGLRARHAGFRGARTTSRHSSVSNA